MDIITALTALGQAIRITKDLRDIDNGLDAAAYKAKMAELYGTLADVKIALTDARETIHNKDQEIKALEARIEALESGDICPMCRSGRMRLTASKRDRIFGVLGVQERTLTCEECKHTESRQFDPNEN